MDHCVRLTPSHWRLHRSSVDWTVRSEGGCDWQKHWKFWSQEPQGSSDARWWGNFPSWSRSRGSCRTPEQLNRIVARRSKISKISRVAVDLDSADSVCHLLRNTRPDALIHLAWYANPGDYLTSHRNLACIGMTTSLVDATLAAGCRKSILVGSAQNTRRRIVQSSRAIRSIRGRSTQPVSTRPGASPGSWLPRLTPNWPGRAFFTYMGRVNMNGDSSPGWRGNLERAFPSP